MEYEEAKKQIYDNIGTGVLIPLADDNIQNGLKFIKSETSCDDQTAKLIWCDLKMDYGTKETNSIIQAREEYEAEEAAKRQFSQPCCPRCGSTAIQAVRRNWSFLGGFMTDAVDRVCLNCKYKF